jgi:RNA polymerase II subunit A-like phosphatase
LLVKKGAICKPNTPLMRISSCLHDIQFAGMCASCGKDLTVATAQGTSKLSSVAIIHGQPRLTITMEEAQRVDKDTAERLLKQKKLSLVLDLDHTLIHAATEIHFQQFAQMHKIDAKGEQIHQFLLPGSSMNYFVKLRPHLHEFLEVVSKLFELHMYTFGTRMYALKVAQIIDPKNTIFKERILSRDECGDMNHKTLKKIFPCDDSMAVIVDDREDVWKMSKNLVRIEPFLYFIGLPEVNPHPFDKHGQHPNAPCVPPPHPSTHPPSHQQPPHNVQHPRLRPPSRRHHPPPHHPLHSHSHPHATNTTTPSTNSKPLEETQTVNTTGSHTEAKRKVEGDNTEPLGDEGINKRSGMTHRKAEESHGSETQQDRCEGDKATITEVGSSIVSTQHQEGERKEGKKEAKKNTEDIEGFLSKPQETGAQGRVDGEASGDPQGASPLPPPPAHFLPPQSQWPPPPDKCLPIILDVLCEVHRRFYSLHDSQKQGDVKSIISDMKREVLAGCRVVFSGFYPRETDPRKTQLGRLAETFGAVCQTDITQDTTHLIAKKNHTDKVKTAHAHQITIVTEHWLYASANQWKRAEEAVYFLPSDENQSQEHILKPNLVTNAHNISRAIKSINQPPTKEYKDPNKGMYKPPKQEVQQDSTDLPYPTVRFLLGIILI